ncbi:MAG: hypothetical protein H6Q74_2537 [Firmicutes bacterium]|nr:hypothetical protein [Bacillota bacterium]
MDIKQLNYFISVAKYLNFTKAAHHHQVAQTLISHQIIALEKEFGTPLFYRNTRSVRLTASGEAFYNKVKPILSHLDQAVSNIKLLPTTIQGTLTIGFNGISEKNFLPYWIHNFLLDYPSIKLKLYKNNKNNLQEALQEENFDIIFQLSNGFDPNLKLTWENICVVSTDHLCAVIYQDHPLAKKEIITRHDLTNEPFVFFDSQANPLGFDLIVKDCNHTGFLPNIVAETSSAEALLVLVESQIGITILPRCFEAFASNNVKFITLADEINNIPSLIAVWRSNNCNPNIPLFINMAKNQGKAQ